ncbi:MerR family transcriptional regulator [Micromonospora sp. NPDC052213]|uniref:MerR family transcriptional regulator n=1 Tax=Micromonospora sp. NPDC052213 TaxID=3155812 RepID=UPI00342C8449
MKSTVGVSIGDAAARFGLATHVLRHWESMGLLAPSRSGGDRRRYDDADLFRIATILRAKEAGLSLADIRAVLATDSPVRRRELLRRHRHELARRIERAQAAMALLDCASGCSHQDLATCPHFREHITS